MHFGLYFTTFWLSENTVFSVTFCHKARNRVNSEQHQQSGLWQLQYWLCLLFTCSSSMTSWHIT